MSSVSLTSPLSIADAAPQRRRAPERDDARTAEPFSLPADKAEPPVRDRLDTSRATETRDDRTSERRDTRSAVDERSSRDGASRPEAADRADTGRSRSEAPKGDAAQADPAKADSTAKSDTTKSDTTKPDTTKTDTARLGDGKVGTAQAVPGAPQEEAVGTDGSKASAAAKPDPSALLLLAIAEQSQAKPVGNDKNIDGDDEETATEAETKEAVAEGAVAVGPQGVLLQQTATLPPGFSPGSSAAGASGAAVGQAGLVAAAAGQAGFKRVGATDATPLAGAPIGSPAETVLAPADAVQAQAATSMAAGVKTAEAKPADAKAGDAKLATEAAQGPSGSAAPADAAAASAQASAEVASGAAVPVAQPVSDLTSLLQAGSVHRTGGVDPAAPSAAPQAAPANAGNTTPAVPLHAVPIEIGMRALSGSRSFDIRLDPVELGRIDVNLEINDKGDVTARLVVDRVETLHLLQRDARTLERAFEQAGLKPSDAGVDISMRDPSDQSGFRQNQQDGGSPRRQRLSVDAPDDVSTLSPQPVARYARLGGVDLSI